MMIASRVLLLLGALVWRVQCIPGGPISCGQPKINQNFQAGSLTYTYTPTTSGTMGLWTCGETQSDTKLTVSNGVDLNLESDDLGTVLCPQNPRASGITFRFSAGVSYTITVAQGSQWAPGSGTTFGLRITCGNSLGGYWERMFNNSGYAFADFEVMNGVWYYNGQSTCVGMGSYWGICPYHHIHCTGRSTYGWGASQVQAVVKAVRQPDHKHPDFSQGCPEDLTCSNTQYTCVNQRCVDRDRLCDGSNDCLDGSDENRALTLDLCPSVDCTTHDDCLRGQNRRYCNSQNTCDECSSCDASTSIDGSCQSCGGDDFNCPSGGIFGCTDQDAINFNEDATPGCDDGSCVLCFNGTGGQSLHLTTDNPSNLNLGLCGFETNGDLQLSCTTSQKYPISNISLLAPITADQPFMTVFDTQGSNPITTPVHWSRVQGPVCDNNYIGVFKWTDLLKDDDSRILIRTDFADSVMFTGWIAVDMYEELEPLRNTTLTRWVRQKLPFRIEFDTKVSTNVTVKVHPAPTEYFAIIEQETIVVDSSTTPPTMRANIVLWSSVAYQFRLTETDVRVNVPELNNPGLTVSLMEDCDPAPGDAACNQKFLITVDLQNECYFSGQYTVDFNISCNPDLDEADCPLVPGYDPRTGVDFDIETENVCPTLIANVVSTGSVKTFAQPRIGTGPYLFEEQHAFMVDNWAFFEVTMNSVDGLIVETIVTRVTLCFDVACTNPTLIYENGVELVDALQVEVLDYPRNPTSSPLPLKSDIKMWLDKSIFVIPEDGCIEFTLLIEVDVKYFHTSMLLEDGEERDLTMVTPEKLRQTKRVQKLLQSTANPESSQGGRANGNGVVHENSGFGSGNGGNPAATVSPTFGALIVMAIAFAMW